MANIALTKYCNLQCPYCFAHEMLEEDQAKNISLDRLKEILSWLLKSPLIDEHIGLIGGEPTLHPQFKEILFIINEFCETYDLKSILFTNGIELYKYIPLLGNNMCVLININQLDNENYNKLIKTLDELYKLNLLTDEYNRFTLGCNLFLEEENYDYFWNIVDKYPGISKLRVSVTAPVKDEYKNNKFEYYIKMKPIFWNFLLEAHKRNLELSFDCNLIPLCFFTPEEQNFISSFGEYKTVCSPTVDITADFQASSCFGTYGDLLVDCQSFDNLAELKNYFHFIMQQKLIHNNSYPCTNCIKLEHLSCQGGCLSFSERVKND